jgi:putative tricarboxylic transport membrane protein
MIFFGLVGYLARKLDFESAPFILAVVLGPMMEKAFRQSVIMSQGDLTTFLTRPLSGAILGVAILLLVLPMFRALKRDKIAALED